MTIALNDEGKEKTEASDSHENEIIQRGSVHRLSKTFEDKSKINRLFSNTSSKKQSPTTKEEMIISSSSSMLTHSKPKATIALAKIRPVSVTRPLQVHFDSLTSEQPSETSLVNNNSLKAIRTEANFDLSENVNKTREQDNLESMQRNQDSFDSSVSLVNKQDHSERGSEKMKTKEIGTQSSPETNERSQQVDVIERANKEQQHGGVSTHDAVQQTDGVVTLDQGVHCEILSQERFTKLQQSALALYKKTVEKKDMYTWSTLPRKTDLSSKVTKQFNKSVQVDLARIQNDGSVDVNKDLNCLKNAAGDLTAAESQTDLSGYVLEKILQDRDTGNAYSKMDVEKTVNSVLKLSEKVKQHTETIRFKAMKSQHGVWYVSLRGDIFLTVSQDILRTAKIKEEHKIAGEVSADILRAMNQFVDNYNKLSDFFDDDEEESDDESFINGFRL